MINTGRSKILDSFFFENQVWGALHKACKGYVIAKNKNEDDKMVDYADIIQECQDDLWLKVSSFNNIGKSALAFYSSRAWQYLCPRTQTCASRLENLLSRRLDFSRV